MWANKQANKPNNARLGSILGAKKSTSRMHDNEVGPKTRKQARKMQESMQVKEQESKQVNCNDVSEQQSKKSHQHNYECGQLRKQENERDINMKASKLEGKRVCKPVATLWKTK